MRYIFFLFYLSIIIPTIWTALGIFIRTSRPQGSGKVYFWSRINLLQFSFLKMSLRIILENIKQGFITWTLTMKWYRGLQNKLDYNFLISVYPRTNIDHKQRSRQPILFHKSKYHGPGCILDRQVPVNVHCTYKLYDYR